MTDALYVRKVSDTGSPLRLRLGDGTGPLDLTEAQTITVRIRKGDGTVITKTATPDAGQDQTPTTTHAGRGWIQAETWAPGDTDVPGGYRITVNVVWSDGTDLTFPGAGFGYIEVQAEPPAAP